MAIRLLGAAALVLSASAALAHPYHVTLAEAEFNAESGRLEVALRVTPEDLELVLSRATGTPIDLEKSDEVDATIVRYLERSFRVRPAGAEEGALHWIGKEVELKWAWLYFEVDLPGGLRGATLADELFFEQFPRQLNTIHLKQGDWRESLSFAADRGSRIIDAPALSPPLEKTSAASGAEMRSIEDSAAPAGTREDGLHATDGRSSGGRSGWIVALTALFALLFGARLLVRLQRRVEAE